MTALRYYNLTGFLGWLWRFRILRRTEQSRGLVRFFDRVVLPVQLRVERTLQLPVGQSVSRRVDGAAAARSLDHVWASVHTLDVDLRLGARAGDPASRHLLRGMDEFGHVGVTPTTDRPCA